MADDSRSIFARIATGGGMVFVGRILELGISFLTAAYIAQELGRNGYGSVTLGATVLSVLTTIVLLGVHTGVARYISRFNNASEQRGVLVAAIQVVLPLAIIVSIALFLGSETVAREVFDDPGLAPVLRIFAVAIPFSAFTKLAVGGMQGLKRTAPKVVIESLTIPVGRFALAISLLVLGYGSLSVAGAYSVAQVLGGVVGLALLLRYTPLWSSATPVSKRRELVKFSLPLVVTGIMMRVLSDIDTMLLGYFPGTEAVGVYRAVYPIASLSLLMQTSLGFILLPVLSDLHSQEDWSTMGRLYQVATKWTFMATFPLFLIIAFFPDIVIELTFGREFVAGALSLSVLAVGFFIRVVAGPNGTALTAIGKTRTVMYDNAFASVLNVVLNLWLIPQYSYLGAAIATALSYLVLNLLYLGHLYRETGIHPLSTGLIKPAAVAVGLVGLFYTVIKSLFEVTLPLLVVAFVVFLGTFTVVILRFGGVEEEEINLLLRFEDHYDVDLEPLKRVAKYLM